MHEPDPPDTATSADTQASAPPLDRSKLQGERKAATERLLARLKALDAAQRAQTSRAYAAGYIREQAPLILRLLDAGVATEEILADLALSFPSIPEADLRYAIAQLRERRQARSE